MTRLVEFRILLDGDEAGGHDRTLRDFRVQPDDALAKLSIDSLRELERACRDAAAGLGTLDPSERARLVHAREFVSDVLPSLLEHLCAEYVLALRLPKDLPESLFAGEGELGEDICDEGEDYDEDEGEEEDEEDEG